jgi:hypothetical protein
MTQNRNQSEIGRLLDTIEQEYHSAFLGFSGLSLGTSRHDFINHRMENIALAGRQLVGLLGENEAGRLIVEQMNKSADKGEL